MIKLSWYAGLCVENPELLTPVSSDDRKWLHCGMCRKPVLIYTGKGSGPKHGSYNWVSLFSYPDGTVTKIGDPYPKCECGEYVRETNSLIW